MATRGRPPSKVAATAAELTERDLDRAFTVLLHRGFNANQIEQLLGSDRKKTAEVCAQTQPSGSSKGWPTFRLKDVAPHLMKPQTSPEELTEMLKRMHPTDLPLMLRKEFWSGQKMKQQYELAAGELWPTQRIIENVGELYKIVAMSARLTADTVERQVELSERQRMIIKEQMNGLLRNIEHSIREKFGSSDKSAQVAKAALEIEDGDL